MDTRLLISVLVVVLLLGGCRSGKDDGILGGGASETQWQRALTATSPDVVRLRVGLCDGLAFGSGFLLNDHQILTNRHVVEDGVTITVEFPDGEERPTDYAMTSPDLDLAVVTLTTPHSGGIPLALASPVLGDQISVLGYPRGGDFKVSRGRMIQLVDGALYGVTGRMAVSDAHVEPGNSGGPVINAEGLVVGVLSAIEFQDGYAMMVPLDEVKSALGEPMYVQKRSCS